MTRNIDLRPKETRFSSKLVKEGEWRKVNEATSLPLKYMNEILDYMLSQTAPSTVSSISSDTGKAEEEIKAALEQLMEENKIRCRHFVMDGKDVSVYWVSSLIPFVDQASLVTSPFESPFDHQQVLERLSDQQLQQEKNWIQTKLRKVDDQNKNYQHLLKSTYSKEDEEKLMAQTQKWLNVVHEMLWDLVSILKKRGQDVTMDKLIKDLRIDPELVKWNADEEDFDV